MRVCILTHTFPRFSEDVAAPFMDGVARGLREAGNDVLVLTPFSPEFKPSPQRHMYKVITYKYIFPDGLHKLGYSRTLADDMRIRPVMYLLSPFMFFFGFLALLRLVRREKIDIINAHWILPNGFIASLVSKITGTPVVSTLPGSDVYMAEKNSLFRLMARFAADTSVAITSNSPQLLEDLVGIGADRRKLSAIIYGVDPKKFKPDRNRNASIRKKLRIGKDSVVVLGVGRLVAKKGFLFLIEAAPQVIVENDKTVFVLIGEGDQRKKLERLAEEKGVSEKFIFLGWVDYKNLVHYYNLADIFILPSVRDEEGNLDDQSVSVVEAMACGKPIVTTDFPGYRIVIQNGKNGFLVPPGDVAQIAEALIKLSTSKKLRDRMGGWSRELVLKNFTWTAVGKQYTSLFKRIKKREREIYYSEGVPKILKEEERIIKARQIIGVLKTYLGETKNLSCLDVGCSSGVISRELSKHFKKVVGIDVDLKAIELAKRGSKRENLRFVRMDAEKMKFKNSSFDVVILNQTYEFVDNPTKLIKETYRVLKEGGVCIVGARNKFAILEGQTGLPFLHFLEKRLAKRIAALLDKEYYPANYMSLFELKELFSMFEFHNITHKIVKNPKKYNFHRLEKYSFLFKGIPKFLLKLGMPLFPNYIFICRKTNPTVS